MPARDTARTDGRPSDPLVEALECALCADATLALRRAVARATARTLGPEQDDLTDQLSAERVSAPERHAARRARAGAPISGHIFLFDHIVGTTHDPMVKRLRRAS